MGRKTKKTDPLVGFVILVVVLVIVGASKVYESAGAVIPATIVAAVIALIVLYRSHRKKKRLEYLRAKYQDEEVVEGILRRQFWRGQTENQLTDSLGMPEDVDTQVLKTKTKETWKYQRQGKNRFALRVTLENGVVVGWSQK